MHKPERTLAPHTSTKSALALGMAASRCTSCRQSKARIGKAHQLKGCRELAKDQGLLVRRAVTKQ